MLHKKRLHFSLTALLVVIVLSAITMSGPKALAQDDLTSEQTFLPLISHQSNNEGAESSLPSELEGDHSEDDYVLAERARERNEPRFEVSDAQTRATGPLNRVGEWGPIRTWPFAFASAANLPDGRIAVWGANNLRSFNGGNFTYSSIWDPETDQLLSRNHNDHSMFCAIPTILEDGRVFANGGDGNSPKTSIFDYRTNQWNRTDNQNTGRWYPGSLVLPGDKVFTMLGQPGGPYPEVWEEGAGWSFLTGANLNNGVLNFSGYQSTWLPYLHLMPSGSVFHSGPTAQMNIINPAGNGSISSAGLTNTWYPKYGSAIMYEEGKVLFAGGGTNGASTNQAFTLDFNGPTPTKTTVAPMNNNRKFNNGVMLPTGEVIMIGGNTSGNEFSDAGTVLEAEIWNPTTETWRPVANMSVPRNYHAVALLMPDGRVWSGGGGLCNCAADHPNHQVYSPPYLFNPDGSLATRPTINSAPDRAGYGATINVQASNNIQRFTMVKMSGVTHNLNSDQRFLNVDFTSPSNGSYSLTLNSNLNVLTPGYWMLFALDDQGVPSVSHALQIQHNSTAVDITNPAGQATHEGIPINLSLNVSNPSGNSLTFSATGLPTGLNLNSTTGAISGTPTAMGQFNASVSVTDGITSDTANFSWIIIEAGNVSYGKLATQSSTYVTGIADNAVDGNSSGVYSAGSVTHTQADANAWWQVDLGESVDISQIDVHNRTDCCSNRTSNVYVFVSDSDLTGRSYNDILNDSSVWRNFTSGQIPNTLEITDATTGRYVRVQLVGTNFLSLAEVEVFRAVQTNQNPILTNPGNLSSPAGSVISQQVNATDPDGDTLTFSATGLPTGLTINSSSGLMAGSLSTTGSYNVTINVDDGNGGSDSISFNWNVFNGLVLNLIATEPKEMGTPVIYTANFAGGFNPRFKWLFGDGTAETGYSTNSNVNHTFAQPGRYLITLTGTDDSGQEISTQFTQLVHRPLTAQRPAVSMSIVYEERAGNDRVWNVNPDNNSVTVSDAVTRQKLAEISVGVNPRALAIAPDGRVWVTNKDDATISVIDAGSFSVVQTVNVSPGSQPHGILFAPNGSDGYVALEATGELVKFNPITGAQRGTADVGPNPRHLSMLADSSRVYVSRFITPPLLGEETGNPQLNSGGGEVVVVNTNMNVVETITLRYSDRPDTEGNGRGIPNYLGPAVISPDGVTAWVPSKQDNIARGTLRDGENLDFDHTVRSIASFVNLSNNQEQFVDRVDFDNGGVAVSGQFDRTGAYLFVALEGSREVAVVDAYAGTELFRIDAEVAPQGIAVSADGQTIFIHNFIDRSITVVDIDILLTQNANSATTLGTIGTVANETLSNEVLVGKSLFYDAKDTRLALDSYMSCASCHNAGDSDGRVWDLTGLGEGLRNTISLQGHANQGPLHWSANFDEVHDFEQQIRDLAGGTGLMTNSDFNATQAPLGPQKAGLSSDLDAMAAYVNSLTTVKASPFRQPNGTLTAIGEAGRQVFVAQGCASCHSGAEFTDSAPGVMHNVGTLKSSSGQRLNGPLNALDTPTLLGLWMTAPYLHDGSAPTLGDAINAHNGVSLSGSDLSNLVSYLNQLDGTQDTIQVNADTKITYQIDRSQLPKLYYNNITMNVYVGSADNITVIADGASIPHTFNQASGMLSFSTESTEVTVYLLNPTESNQLGNFSVAELQDNRDFAWSIGFDDNVEFRDAIESMNSKGYRGTIFAITDLIDPTRDESWIVDEPALAQYLAQGWSLSPHGKKTTCDDANETEISAAFDHIEEIVAESSVPDYVVTSFAAPCFIADYHPVILSLRDSDQYDVLFNESGDKSLMVVDPGASNYVEANDNQFARPLDLTIRNSDNFWLIDRDDPIGRDLQIEIDYQTAVNTLDWIASNSGPDQHFWYNMFLHGIDGATMNNFATYLQSNYENQAWVAPSDQIYSYLLVRDLATVTSSGPVDIDGDGPPSNTAPVLTAPGNQNSETGDSVSLQLTSTDADNDILAFTSANLPAGLTLNNSGLISGSPTTAGVSNVTVSINDGNGGTDSVSFTWTVATDTPQPTTGQITWEYWNTTWGSDLATLRDDPNFPDNPANTSYLTSFEAPIDRADIFGQKISGFLYPPITGDYTFWIASDDQGELWLSTDDQPDNIILLASVRDWTNSRQWEKYPEQTSQTVSLQAGQAYYVEALAQEGAGGDHLAIAWQIPGDSREIIAGQYLAPVDGITGPTNNPPVLTSPGNQANEVGDIVDLQLIATDGDNDTLTFSAPGLPAGLNLNPNSGRITGSLLNATALNVNVTVNDSKGGTNSVSFLWTVTDSTPPPPGNTDPVLSNVANQTNEVGDTVSLQLSANDIDNGSLTYSVTGLPAGLSLSANNGLISGSPTAAVSTNVTVSVSDGNGGSDSVNFVWTVSTPPPTPPGAGTGEILWETWNTGWGTDLAVLRGDPNFPDNPATSNTLTTFESPVNRGDIFGQKISGYIYPPVTGNYTFWIASDDQGELWLSTDDQAANISEIASVPSWTDSREWTKYPEQQSTTILLQAGQTYYVEALAQEGGGGDNLAVAWQIPGGSREVVDGQYLSPADAGVNPPPPPPPPGNTDPVLTNPGNQTDTEGDSVSLTLQATDIDNDSLTFSVNQLPAGLSLNGGNGQISGSPTTAGATNVTVNVNDGDGGTDSVSFNWTINEPAPPPPPPPGGGTGEIRLETWNTSWGTTLSVLRATTSFPSSPDSTQTLTSFEAPVDRGSVFGQRISGFVYPPVTGDYTFWIASDDQGELWLSTTNSRNDIVLLATVTSWTDSRDWDKDSTQESVTITLQAGQAYYIEALAQEGGGGDNLAVAWQIPGQARQVIDGQYLASID